MYSKKVKDTSLSTATRVLDIESKAVSALIKRLDGNFTNAVELILAITGKVVVSGMGKSGIICQKVASTLSSTGTPAFFLHPAEGVHGDLGMLMKNDILLAVSNSGETDEILKIVPIVKRMGIKMIAMTGRTNSTLARYADAVLDVGVKVEACVLGLSPTASTTATLAMGDALAVALLERRGFRAEDFAELHPAGALGRKFLRVKELMRGKSGIPMVGVNTSMKDAVAEITNRRIGLTGVFKGARLTGIITDGDIRRALLKGEDIMKKSAGDVMTKNPRVISGDSLAEAALRMMEEFSITALFVTDGSDKRVIGVIHLHDLIRGGVI